MGKARPERIRFTLWDDAGRGTPLALPRRSTRPAGLILAVFFAIFASIEGVMIAKMIGHSVNDVFDLTFVLFELFWLLGWSVGVIVLGALTALFLFHNESARIEPGRLVHVPRLGPLKIVCEYDLAGIRNLRIEPAKDGDEVRVRFDYGKGSNGLGDTMAPAAAERLVEQISRAASRYQPASAPAPENAGESESQRDAQAASGPEVSAARPVKSAAADLPQPAPALTLSALALIAANLLPLIGVVLMGWNLSDVMVLYWAESAVIGFYTVVKMFVVAKWIAPFAALFFVGHFGGFMAAHFMFIYGLFIRGGESLANEPGAYEALLQIFGPLWPALAALFVSHGVSFLLNFVGAREYATTTLSDLTTAPYKRIMIMHITIILGGFLVMVLRTPAPALALLIVVKTAVDWRAHSKEHATTPAQA